MLSPSMLHTTCFLINGYCELHATVNSHSIDLHSQSERENGFWMAAKARVGWCCVIMCFIKLEDCGRFLLNFSTLYLFPLEFVLRIYFSFEVTSSCQYYERLSVAFLLCTDCRKFFGTANFESWLRYRQHEVNQKLEVLHIEAMCQAVSIISDYLHVYLTFSAKDWK